jgi:hypothetical protein
MSIHERKERQFKKRLRRKKKKWKSFKVVAAYRKKSEDQINLHVGDEVKIIKRAGELMKGKARGRIGWFPGEFVDNHMPSSKFNRFIYSLGLLLSRN